MKVMATSRVRITLDILPGDSWGEECKMDQVFKQASDEAVAHVRRILRDEILAGRIAIHGDPEVLCVMAKKGS